MMASATLADELSPLPHGTSENNSSPSLATAPSLSPTSKKSFYFDTPEEAKSEALRLAELHRTGDAAEVLAFMRHTFGQESVVDDPVLAAIAQRKQEVDDFCSTIDSREGWICHLDNGEKLRVLYKGTEGCSAATLRCEGLVDAPLIDILSVLNEIDLFKMWVPYFTIPIKLGLRDSLNLWRNGRIDQIDIFKVDMPWPFSNRETCLFIFAVDELESARPRIVARMYDTDHNTDKMPRDGLRCIPAVEDGACRLGVDGGIALYPKSANLCYLQASWTVDFKVDIPGWLITFICRQFAWFAWRALKHICRSASKSPTHMSRRAHNRALYGFIESRLKETKLLVPPAVTPLPDAMLADEDDENNAEEYDESSPHDEYYNHARTPHHDSEAILHKVAAERQQWESTHPTAGGERKDTGWRAWLLGA
ncbi:unnamed protein product [Vitrella brassicaformis CCMP3155]|uniref:START domain-containing protein n=2 Tax=Vitrella brassicaformis TaxID=1169539 RepID=A0A0G4GLA1_VITBC|nr:unnamed protein product [Vitrella brassicaformis CCMP3155]|eukprot:CEM30859.1 unnamed protein product [Vitrella brassicaformis CCMP3155]